MAEELKSPATLDPAKIRELSGRWTLGGDAGLLKYLENSSERLVSRVTATGQQLNDSIWEATQAAVRFDNVHNQFVALAGKQFFENRVYDEDIPKGAEVSSKLSQAKEAKSKAEKESETIASMREAVSLGCRLVGSHFKRIEIRPQDFDEDDDPTFKPEPIFEPLDPYLVRPLPFLIGSKEFAMSKSVGLVEQEQQATSTAIQENDDLVIDVGTRVPNPPSLPQRPATEALPAPAEKAPSDHSGLYAASSGSGDSGELFADDHRVTASVSRNDADSLFNEPVQNVQPSSSRSIQDELAAKLGLPPNIVAADRKPLPKTVTPSVPPPKAAAEESDNEGDIFEAPPPLPQPTKGKSAAPTPKVDSLFETRTGGLFDSDEEDDLFAPPKPRAQGAKAPDSSTIASKPTVTEAKPLPAPSVPKPAPPAAATGIFDDAVDEPDDHSDIFAPITKNTQPPAKIPAKTAQPSGAAIAPSISSVPKTTPKSLFDDDSEEDDIFNAPPRKSQPTTTATKELFTDPSPPTVKQPPIGGVSVFPSIDRLPTPSTAVKKTVIPDPLAEKREETKIDVQKTVVPEVADHRSSTASPSTSLPVESEKQLIPPTPSDNSPVPDNKQSSKPFGGVSVLPQVPTPSIRHETPAVVKKKLSEENIEENRSSTDIFEPPACPSQPSEETPSPKTSRFALDNNSDDEDLFSPKSSINSTPSNSARQNLANVMVAGLKKNLAQANAPSSPPKPTSPSSAVSEPRFNEPADDHQPLESLAKTRAKIPTSSRRPPTRRPFSPPKSSLFESDSDGDQEESTSPAIQPAVSAAVASPLSLQSEPPPLHTPSVTTSSQPPPPLSSSVESNSGQPPKISAAAAASLKSPLFDSDSDNDDDESKLPPSTSKTAVINAEKSPSDLLAQASAPQTSQIPSRVVEKEEPKPAPKSVPEAKTPAPKSVPDAKTPAPKSVPDAKTPVPKSVPDAKTPTPKSFPDAKTPAPKAVPDPKTPAPPAATTLFDSDDDEDIFAPVAAKSTPTTSAAAAAKPPTEPVTAIPTAAKAAPSLFTDDDADDIFATNKPSGSAKPPTEPPKTSAPVKKSAAASKGALFGDDSDSDLDIFK